jgi:hypothetical protein
MQYIECTGDCLAVMISQSSQPQITEKKILVYKIEDTRVLERLAFACAYVLESTVIITSKYFINKITNVVI